MTTTDTTSRPQVYWATGLNMLIGVWLLISSAASYVHSPMAINNILCGVAIGVVAAVRASGAYDRGWVSWLNILLGAWVVVSPWAVMGLPGPTGPSTGMIVNNAIAGGAVVLLGCFNAFATESAEVAYADATRPSFGR